MSLRFKIIVDTFDRSVLDICWWTHKIAFAYRSVTFCFLVTRLPKINHFCRRMAASEAISSSRMFESLRFVFQRKGRWLTMIRLIMDVKQGIILSITWLRRRWCVGFEADESRTRPLHQLKLIRHALSLLLMIMQSIRIAFAREIENIWLMSDDEKIIS